MAHHRSSLTADTLMPVQLGTSAGRGFGRFQQPDQIDHTNQSQSRLDHEERIHALGQHQTPRVIKRGRGATADRLAAAAKVLSGSTTGKSARMALISVIKKLLVNADRVNAEGAIDTRNFDAGLAHCATAPC